MENLYMALKNFIKETTEKSIKFFFIFTFYLHGSSATNLEIGEKLFLSNCNVCHKDGNNIIIPEKNLKKETLESNGMYNLDAIIYQVTNGKNGMPAFGGRLSEDDIQNVANYVLAEGFNNKN
jgi:cytochrome c6